MEKIKITFDPRSMIREFEFCRARGPSYDPAHLDRKLAGFEPPLCPQRATAVLKLDSGNAQPIQIAIPDFVSVATQDPAAGLG